MKLDFEYIIFRPQDHLGWPSYGEYHSREVTKIILHVHIKKEQVNIDYYIHLV